MPKPEAFLPRTLLKALADGKGAAADPALRGACLFADISGFTALSEMLYVRMGKEGSEVLTKLMNSFLTETVEVIEAWRGDVIRFSGDAVTAFFPREEWCLGAATALQSLMPRFENLDTPVGPVTLRMKIGAASGDAHCTVVGGGGQMDYAFWGPANDGAVAAEHHARPGEIVVRRGGRLRTLHRMPGRPPTGNRPASPAVPGAHLRSFQHPIIREALAHRQAAYLNEHRMVSILFVRFEPLRRPADPAEVVRMFYHLARERVAALDGFISRVETGDKGNTLLILFGAPKAHEDDTVRAVECALELERAAKASGFDLRIGLNSAKVFCGIVGSDRRCEYTVMGDGANTAARLMQAASAGGHLASASIKEQAGRRFLFQDLPPLLLKGKRDPFPICRIEGRRGEEAAPSFFVGRAAQEKSLREALDSQPPDRAALIHIHGDAGCGKTAFLRHFINKHFPGQRAVTVSALSHLSQPYACARRLVEGLLDGPLKGGKPAEAVIVARDPDIRPFVPIFLNTFAPGGKPLPEPALEPEIRRSLLWKMATLLVDDALQRGPLFLVVDGAQWMDGESKKLVHHIVRMTDHGGLRVFFTDRGAPPEEPALTVVPLALPPLSPRESREFLCRTLSVGDLPVEALRAASNAASGNPALLREALQLLFQSGYLARDETYPQVLLVDESKRPELPQRLSELVLSQMDSLPLTQKTVLRTLSVAGDCVETPLAEELALDRAALDGLTGDGRFILYDATRQAYLFSRPHHAAAIYDSLDYSLRRELHARVGRAVQRVVPPDHPGLSLLLAHHLGEAGLPEALPFLLGSAQTAQHNYAIQDAVRLYEKALAIGRSCGHDLPDAVPALARLYLLAGRTDDAIKLILQNVETLPSAGHSAAHRLLADAYSTHGQFKLAEDCLAKARSSARTPRDRFLTLSSFGKLYGKTGRFKEARRCCTRVKCAFAAFKNDTEYRMNLMRLSFLDFQLGRKKRAIDSFVALKNWFINHGDAKGHYTTLNNLGHLFFLEGKYKRALSHLLQSLNTIKHYGIWEPDITISLLMNIGIQHVHLGSYDTAIQYYLKCNAYSKRYNSSLLYYASYAQADLLYRKGQIGSALSLLIDSIKDASNLLQPTNDILETLLEFHLVIGDAQGFAKYYQEYESLIEKRKLSFLRPRAVNFKAEGSLIGGVPDEHISPIRNNLNLCIKNKQYVDAYRAARFLFQITGKNIYWLMLRKLINRIHKAQYKTEHAYLEYSIFPTSRNKIRLIALLKRHPYAFYNWKALVAFANHATNNRIQALYCAKAVNEANRIMTGLDPALRRAFMRGDDYKSLCNSLQLLQGGKRPASPLTVSFNY